MIPVISSMILLFISVEKKRISAIISMAPINAPSSTEKKPDKLNAPAVMLPPNSNMTKATPRLAPALMPRMDGPASGFLKAVCNISPQTANAPPQSSAVSAWGKRDSQRMKLQLAFSPSPPSRIRKTSAGGIETDPTSRLPAKSNKITTPNPIPYFQPLLIVTLFSTQRHGGTEFSITFTKVPYLCVHHSFSLQK